MEKLNVQNQDSGAAARGVVAWTCPRCRQVVGVKNLGTPDAVCQSCQERQIEAYWSGLTLRFIVVGA